MLCGFAALEEVFRTEEGAVYQCGNKNCYWLEFAGDCTPFKVADFLRFKRMVDEIDLDTMVTDSSRRSDFTILMPYRCQRCFLLDVKGVLALQNLLEGAHFAMQLTGVLNECFRMSELRM